MVLGGGGGAKMRSATIQWQFAHMPQDKQKTINILFKERCFLSASKTGKTNHLLGRVVKIGWERKIVFFRR